MGRPLKIAKAQAILTITDTATTGSIVTISGGNLTTAPTVGIISGMPFICAVSISGIDANTTYYVDTILSNNTFSVSTTDLSVQPRIMAALLNSTGGTVRASFTVVDNGFSNPNNTDTSFPTGPNQSYGVVGGNTSIYGSQVLARVAIPRNGTGTISTSTSSTTVTGVGTSFLSQLVAGSALSVNGVFIGYLMFAPTSNTSLDLFIPPSITVSGQSFVYADDEPGWIVRQKAKSKYLVYGTTTGLTAQCSLTNTLVGAVLQPGQMFIQSTNSAAGVAPIAALNDYNSELYPATVAPSALVVGTLYTIYSSGNTDWAVCGSASSMTGVSFIARAVGTGTGTAILADVNPDVIATFGTAASANGSYPGSLPVVTIASA
jgi:hypothetical protein